MFSRILIVLLLATPLSAAQRGGGGGGAPPMNPDPTPFDVFVEKMKLTGGQIEQTQKIFEAAAAQAQPIAQEMLLLRQKLLAAESAGKADEVTATLTAYSVAAAKMTVYEISVLKQMQGILKGGQWSKSGDGLTVMAGIFHPPAPRGRGAAPRRGGGGGQ